MCRGSLRAKRTEPATEGEVYQIGQVFYGDERAHRHGVLFKDGNGYAPDAKGDAGKVVHCAACIREETPVQLSQIPVELQDRMGLKPTERATFLPGETTRNDQDTILFENGRPMMLWQLADQGIALSLIAVEAAPAVADPVVEREPAMA